MTPNPLNQLANLRQSIWYDNVQSSLLLNGEIVSKIHEDCLTGLTSNPTIFNNAISQSSDYNEAIADALSGNPEAEILMGSVCQI